MTSGDLAPCKNMFLDSDWKTAWATETKFIAAHQPTCTIPIGNVNCKAQRPQKPEISKEQLQTS
jgi:hypothetical protein